MADLTVDIRIRLDNQVRAGGRTAYAIHAIIKALRRMETDAIIAPPERRPVLDETGSPIGAVTVRHIQRRGRFHK